MLESPVGQRRHLKTSQLDEEIKIELRNKLRNSGQS